MKFTKYDSFPKLRREYETAEEMANVIFKGVGYIYSRLNGQRAFTYREKVALLQHIGKGPDDIPEYFPEEKKSA